MRGNARLRPVHPARPRKRPPSAGLLAPGSSRSAPLPGAVAPVAYRADALRLQLRGQRRYRTGFPLRPLRAPSASARPV